MYTCKYCGKEFETKQKLGGHILHCILNPNYDKSLKQLQKARKNINKVKKHLHCQYCRTEVGNEGCLAIHEKACEKNPNREKCPNRIGNGGNSKGHTAWNKNLTSKDSESIRNILKTKRKNFLDGKYKNLSHPHSEETKEKLRKYFKEKIEKQKGKFKCFYNKKACEYINKLNEKNNWMLQHAENGGEIECIGYFLDGYDKDLNIVFEYDEPRHYKDKLNNILKDKDIQRQQNIINELHCEFWRYNEYLDLLYKVN